MNKDLGTVWKEGGLVCWKVPGKTEENYETLIPIYSVHRPRFETGIYRKQLTICIY